MIRFKSDSNQIHDHEISIDSYPMHDIPYNDHDWVHFPVEKISPTKSAGEILTHLVLGMWVILSLEWKSSHANPQVEFDSCYSDAKDMRSSLKYHIPFPWFFLWQVGGPDLRFKGLPHMHPLLWLSQEGFAYPYWCKGCTPWKFSIGMEQNHHFNRSFALIRL